MTLTPHQQHLLQQLKDFIQSKEQEVFILRGYAGTGKTTLIGFLLQWITDSKQKVKPTLLASTGRAARILQAKTQMATSTIHSHIYSFSVIESKNKKDAKDSWENQNGQLYLSFDLKPNKDDGKDTLYIIDEASMLSYQEQKDFQASRFGTGNVLADFLQYAKKSKVIFVGDPAQLPPPVGINPFSAALAPNYLSRTFNKKVLVGSLTEILRQEEGTFILKLASQIREQIKNKQYTQWEELMGQSGKGIFHPFNQNILFKRYLPLLKQDQQQAIIITHSNKQAYYLNQNIRELLGHKSRYHLYENSLLMVSQNSYDVDLANGDQVIFKKAKFVEKRAGFTFLEVELIGVHNQQTYKTYMLKEFLFSPEANISQKDHKNLLIDFDKRARYKGLKRNSSEYKQMMLEDKFLNALRAKFGYAITCHKSQGGEWPHVFLNLSNTLDRLEGETRLRWLYTAVSRAQKRLDIKPVYRPPNKNNNTRIRWYKLTFLFFVLWQFLEQTFGSFVANRPPAIHFYSSSR